ncbi:MAG TPA: protein-tyrosine phosphatase family protein [Methanospirillum sp.]|nr:protein-tyrosine phosphatase family protein [Methanospirillum sp.]
MFRRVTLPRSIAGRLYLTSMPGAEESMAEFNERAVEYAINRIICLTPMGEVDEESLHYAQAIRTHTNSWEHTIFPIPDYGIPRDWKGFLDLVKITGSELQAGKNALTHCRMGIGRTGMFATVVLMALGVPYDQAKYEVKSAGSNPETRIQRDLIAWCREQLQPDQG